MKLNTELQRGRAPESAEWVDTQAATVEGELASTGPRSGERGVNGEVEVYVARFALQRGRAPESAEWDQQEIMTCLRSLLQRGRAPESAEWESSRATVAS